MYFDLLKVVSDTINIINEYVIYSIVGIWRLTLICIYDLAAPVLAEVWKR